MSEREIERGREREREREKAREREASMFQVGDFVLILKCHDNLLSDVGVNSCDINQPDVYREARV